MARQCARKDILDWWQAVLDETKDLVDDTIDGVRDTDDVDDDLAAEVAELKKVVAALNAKLDAMLSAPAPAAVATPAPAAPRARRTPAKAPTAT